MTTNPKDIAQLGRAVRDRRTELRMTQDDVAAAGGPSDVTVRKIESGKVSRINVATLSKLDEALQWAPGTAVGHLDRKVDDVVTPAPRPVYLHEASDADLLIEVSRRMSEQRARHDRTADHPQSIKPDTAVPSRALPDGATIDEDQSLYGLAALERPSRGKALKRATNRLGEESQDPGHDHPA